MTIEISVLNIVIAFLVGFPLVLAVWQIQSLICYAASVLKFAYKHKTANIVGIGMTLFFFGITFVAYSMGASESNDCLLGLAIAGLMFGGVAGLSVIAVNLLTDENAFIKKY